MTEAKGYKKNQKQPSIVYAAFKAKNEIYYQMASVFKLIGHDDGRLAKKVLKKYLPRHSAEIFLEKIV